MDSISIRYAYGSILLALAVSTKLYTMALDSAPFALSQNSRFFDHHEGRIAFSARLLLGWITFALYLTRIISGYILKFNTKFCVYKLF